MSEVWSGTWVADHLGVLVEPAPTDPGEDVRDLVGTALRENPRRLQLLVSRVLGKHVPTAPEDVRDAGHRLGHLVADLGLTHPSVMGFAETATALGHLVADVLGAPYLHSTRRLHNGAATWTAFTEEHSHAPSHVLQPWPFDQMLHRGPLVLVDDELSTATTVLNAIRQLQLIAPRRHYVVAALVDVRDEEHRGRVADVAAELGVLIECLSLARGRVTVPSGVTSSAARTAVDLPEGHGTVTRIGLPWPADVRESGRHGFDPCDPRYERAVTASARALSAVLPDGPVHVLGTEELMYTPLRLALELPGTVTFSTTTRSPAIVIDHPGYPLRTSIGFPAHENGSSGTRFAYNLRAGAYSSMVLVLDEESDTPSAGELITRLRSLTPALVVAVLPSVSPPVPLTGPVFGSYPTDDVSWLVTDLSGVELEAPTEEREDRIQSGGHYAETLPVEYSPTVDYTRLFHRTMRRSAGRTALAVSVVGEQILSRRGPGTVLVSLARAGTPVGILLRRWAARIHELDWPHYTLSIVRDRGIDEVALAHLAAWHDPARVVFVDGWTGKGAIARELVTAIRGANGRLDTSFDPTLAVLADPGSCAEIFGTRDDFLVPSACLNSTVSGLVSRTVLNPALLRADQFHGAKFYADLADDVSNAFVDTVAQRLDDVQPQVAGALADLVAAGRTPTWAGWTAVENLAQRFGISDLNLIKPGVGETTRVLLRRMPSLVVVHPGRLDDLAHVLQLAEERDVELVEDPELPFSCVGLIRPRTP